MAQITEERYIELGQEAFMQVMGGLIITHSYMNHLPDRFLEEFKKKIQKEKEDA